MAQKYNFREIEKRWQKKWRESGVYEPDPNKVKNPFYNLMMFPYPSAEGLHVGNMYAFTGSDIYGRFKRMQGNDVFEPIGLDGFGIHSENYALKIGAHPMRQAKVSEKRFYKQLEMIGNGFAWDERLETYDPEYYKWTQWIFTKLFNAGLAYRKKQAVNWCPSCKTVLADEQVIPTRNSPPQADGGGAGKCERCGTVVVKKELEQWFFRITKYAEKLLKNLEKLDWSEKVKIAQKNWIGRSEGVYIRSKIKDLDIKFEVFDSVPQTFMAQTFTVIAPEHPFVPTLVQGTKFEKPILEFIQKIKNEKVKKGFDPNIEPEGIFTGRYVDNPFGTGDLPIWVASFVVMEYGTGIVHCSAHDERDFMFAKKYKIPLRPVMFPLDKMLARKVRNLEFAYCRDPQGILEQPKEFAGRQWGEVRKDIIALLEKKGIAKKAVNYRLRDWLISRQRYWGPPIPLVFCEACKKRAEISNFQFPISKQIQNFKFSKGELENPGWVAVPEDKLPIKLPFIKDFRPTGKGTAPLATHAEFYKTKCPKCGGEARRETDVSDTFLDSAWYYLGYLARNDSRFMIQDSRFSRLAKKWLPVDMYIGGAEHSVLHLLYVRFLALALHDLKLLEFGPSPAPKGEPFPKFRAHGLLIKEGGKMSKSKGNVVNPDEYIKNFGADVLRMYLMFLAPFEQGGDFRDAGIAGPERFLIRVYGFFKQNKDKLFPKHAELPNKATRQELAKTIKKVTEDIERLSYNTAISKLMTLLYYFEADNRTNRGDAEDFLKLLAPFAPHITEEIWHEFLGKKTSIHKEKWPISDKNLIKEEIFTLVIQVNGKVRDSVEAPANIKETEARKLALGRERIRQILGQKEPKRVIYVPRRLVNIVI